MTQGNGSSKFELAWLDPYTLKPHPRNPRRHPQAQRHALHESLASLGWVQPLIFNERTGRVLDGHLRLQEAIEAGHTEVPVIVLDLDVEHELAVLTSLDAISAAADVDSVAYSSLLSTLADSHASLAARLQDLRTAEEDSTQAALANEKPDIEGIMLVPGESYHYIALLFRTDLDFLNALAHFEITAPALDPLHESKAVGPVRVVDGATYLARRLQPSE